MTQPAVSNILKQLEDYFDCRLIEVVRKKLSLTEEGHKLLDCAQQIRTIIDNTKSEINLIHGIIAGHLRVATVSTAKYFVPRLLGAFKNLYPQVHIELTVKNREQIISRLEHNLDDFVIMSQPPELNTIEKADFYHDQLVVVASVQHRLANKKNMSLKDLKDEAWLMREKGSGTRIAIQSIFKKHRLQPNITMEIDNNESIKQAVMANMGISIISKKSIELELATKHIKILDIQGFPIQYKWFLVKNKQKKLSHVASEFHKFALSHPDLASFSNQNIKATKRKLR